MISEDAIRVMEQTAKIVGFGPRRDYPFLGASALSAGDWKGASIAACVFAHPDHAHGWIDRCLSGLEGLGEPPEGSVYDLSTDYGQMYIAVITAQDMVLKREMYAEDIRVSHPYGTEVHPTPTDVLEKNARNPRKPSKAQIGSLRALCAKNGLTESDLIAMGVQEGRLSRKHAANADTAKLESLTQPEIGGLFAFQSWLRGENDILGHWINSVWDVMPSRIRNSPEWREALIKAIDARKQCDRTLRWEQERLEVIMDWMWDVVLPTYQPLADGGVRG